MPGRALSGMKPGAAPPWRVGPGALVILLVTGALLATTSILSKVGAREGIAPLALLGWSLVGATALLTVALRLKGVLPALGRGTREYHLVAGLVSLAAPNLVFFLAVGEVGASFVVLSLTLPPLLTYAGAFALGMEPWCPRRAAGVGLALGGAALLALEKLELPDASIGWIVATLLGPVLLAAGNVYRSARWPTGASAESLAPGMLAASAMMLLGLGALCHAARTAGMTIPAGLSLGVDVTRPTVLGLLAAQSGVFAITYLLFFQLQARGGPVLLSLIGSVAAVAGVPAAVLLFDESVPASILPAAALLAAGLALVVRGRPRGTD